MDWRRIVGSIVNARLRAGLHLGLTKEDLESVGHLAALEAERTWDPSGGRSLSSWVYLCTEFAIRSRLTKIAREFADDSMDQYEGPGRQDPETATLVSEALNYLQARLTQAEWRLLWLYHGEGYSAREVAEQLGLSYGTVRNRLSIVHRRAVTILEPNAWCV